MDTLKRELTTDGFLTEVARVLFGVSVNLTDTISEKRGITGFELTFQPCPYNLTRVKEVLTQIAYNITPMAPELQWALYVAVHVTPPD